MSEHPSAHVADRGDKAALIMGGTGRVITYRELDEASNRFAQMLRSRGLTAGDHLAVLLLNRHEWFEVVWGALRTGLYVTPVNRHLTSAEAGYIVSDCGARALVADGELDVTVKDMAGDMVNDMAAVDLRLAVGGAIDGFESYENAVVEHPAEPVSDQCEGSWMLYSSGTTGRPKGIKPPPRKSPLGEPTPFGSLLTGLYGFSADTVYLSPGPLYHAGPAGWTTMTQRFGGTVVVMENFDAAEMLRLIERYRVTHVQVVPTHLVRLLKLPDDVREAANLSSLQVVVHAAAPCPPAVKRAALEWLGPIVQEFYSGSEGVGFCAIGPEEWLAHPGSVGKSLMGEVHILGEDGEKLPPGEVGQVWFDSANTFEYHRNPGTTASAWNDRGWSTLGDIGRVDEEGYVYLTDRVGNTIISGGVNIYPREAEDVLITHSAITDVAVVGRPDDEMGERVVAFVELADASTAGNPLADELVRWCRERLTHFKCPREVRFVEAVPRSPAGKLMKRFLPD